MTKPNNKTEGRGGSAFFLAGGAFASIVFNVWGAHQIFDGFAAWIFAFGVLCLEICAFLTLRHIIQDWNNNHRAKPSVAIFIFGLMVVLCFYSGHTAFDGLQIEKAEANKVFDRDAAEAQRLANLHFAKAEAARLADDRRTETQERARGALEQQKADAIKLSREKNKPVPPLIVLVFLACFEAIKVFGRWSIATETKLIWTPERRRAEKEKQKAREAEAKAARVMAEGGKHLHAVPAA